MKKFIWVIISLAILAFIVFKLSVNKRTTERTVYHNDIEKPVSVDVDTIRLGHLEDESTYAGTFEPNKETKISAETQGKINAILVDLGNYVHQGQPLIQLDNSLMKLQLQSVEVQIEGLREDVTRYTVLVQSDAVNGIQLEKAKLALKSAEIQKATIEEQINKSTINAPFNGIVTAKMSEVGAFAAPGVPLLQITDIAILKFTVNVPETDLNKFQTNQIYSISADAFPDISLSGRLIMTGSKANLGNSFPVQFQVANTKQLSIKSGMFGKVNLSTNNREQGIVIPTTSIIDNAGKDQVYVVKNGKATLQTITTSKHIGNKSIVIQGLNEGDVIVINGFINLFDGANINIK